MTLRIGFIGLGRMGQGMALNILKGGADLLVFDPVEAAMNTLVQSGAKAAASVADVARQADIVFTSLPGPAEVKEVVLGEEGIVANMRQGLVLFDLSTNSPAMVREVGEAMAAKGAAFLDAPVSGGPAGAASGDLVLWIGGDESTFSAHRPLLETFSKPCYVGPITSGTVTKLAHNMLGYTIMESLAEAFTLATKAGLDPLNFWEALRMGMVGKQSPLFMLTQQFLPNIYDKPAFALKLALKDVRLATQMAEELDVPMRLSRMTKEDMEAAVSRGQGDEDSRSFLKLQIERAGVQIELPKERIDAAVHRARA